MKRLIKALGLAAALVFAVACDQVTTAGSNWVFYPDYQMHQQAQLGGEIQYSGLCAANDGSGATWWARSWWVNIYNMPQGSSVIAPCGVNGHPTGGGNWGVEYR